MMLYRMNGQFFENCIILSVAMKTVFICDSGEIKICLLFPSYSV